METRTEDSPNTTAIKIALEVGWKPQQDGSNHWFKFSATHSIAHLSEMPPCDETL